MSPWCLVIVLCLVDGVLCHELMKAWDKLKAQKMSFVISSQTSKNIDDAIKKYLRIKEGEHTMDEIEKAIDHFQVGITHDIFSEPVTSYAMLATQKRGCRV